MKQIYLAFSICRNKKSRLSLLLTKSGSHENVSPDKKPPAKPNQ